MPEIPETSASSTTRRDVLRAVAVVGGAVALTGAYVLIDGVPQ